MDILHKNDKTKGEFYIENNSGDVIAKSIYKLQVDNIMVIEHIEVDPSLRGQGIGAKLIEASVKYARMQYFKIIPLCSYAEAVLKKTPEYLDVIAN